MTEAVTTRITDLCGRNVIHAYTRAQAIADGVLVPVDEAIAREAGFRLAVALTAAVWADCVAWTDEIEAAMTCNTGQDEAGRLWDVLWMARAAARKAGPGANQVRFPLLRIPPTGPSVTARSVVLSLRVGPGDDAEPVMTICEPGED